MILNSFIFHSYKSALLTTFLNGVKKLLSSHLLFFLFSEPLEKTIKKRSLQLFYPIYPSFQVGTRNWRTFE